MQRANPETKTKTNLRFKQETRSNQVSRSIFTCLISWFGTWNLVWTPGVCGVRLLCDYDREAKTKELYTGIETPLFWRMLRPVFLSVRTWTRLPRFNPRESLALWQARGPFLNSLSLKSFSFFVFCCLFISYFFGFWKHLHSISPSLRGVRARVPNTSLYNLYTCRIDKLLVFLKKQASKAQGN